jgi:2-C-methyl-D-erythritol 4-phosphate cytidylyltransferase
MKISCILLAGGKGTRMGHQIPKQFLSLLDRPLIDYSIEKLQHLDEVVIVCDPSWRHLLPQSFTFADPGPRRQDSVFSGLSSLKSEPDIVLIHDGARPLFSDATLNAVIDAAREFGASAPALPLSFTLKQATKERFVKKTLKRENLYEIQTPQAVRFSLLMEGYKKVHRENLEVTDDVSIVELLGHPVKLVLGNRENLKITTPIDLVVAEQLLLQHANV